MTFTAMRPESGLSNGRDVSLRSVAQASRVDLGLEGGLQRLVRVTGSQEVGVADEKRLFVVVGVDEPAGLCPLARRCVPLPCWDGTRPRRLTLTWIWSSSASRMSMSGSPKMTKRLPLPVFFRSSAMWRSAFIRALRTGTRPRLSNSVVCAS